METSALDYNAPGLLFPAISLLMLAYTNRYLGISSLVRELVERYRRTGEYTTLAQINMLARRMVLLRHMQASGVISLLLCTGAIFALFMHLQLAAQVLFGTALLAMLASLVLSLREVYLSVHALNLEIDGIRAERSE